MNLVTLRGLVKNISYSHSINNTIYQSADMIVLNSSGREDTIKLLFKKCFAPQLDGDIIALTGAVRSYTEHLDNNKNKVNIYVLTYFDKPEKENQINKVLLDGRICKIDELRTTKNNKLNFHVTLANNIFLPDQNLKINNYLPLVFWGNLAQNASTLQVNDQIQLEGQLHSRLYTKTLDNGEKEIRMAHEIVVLNYEKKL